eukprot:scaffold1127_cov361-Prasinococcus_capsulatus_cf.AAC.6
MAVPSPDTLTCRALPPSLPARQASGQHLREEEEEDDDGDEGHRRRRRTALGPVRPRLVLSRAVMSLPLRERGTCQNMYGRVAPVPGAPPSAGASRLPDAPQRAWPGRGAHLAGDAAATLALHGTRAEAHRTARAWPDKTADREGGGPAATAPGLRAHVSEAQPLHMMPRDPGARVHTYSADGRTDGRAFSCGPAAARRGHWAVAEASASPRRFTPHG